MRFILDKLLPRTKNFKKGLHLCHVLHEGQFRKGAVGEPYAYHPQRVALTICEYLRETIDDENLSIDDIESLLVATLLHDTIEDCDITPDELLEALDTNPSRHEIVQLVLAVTNPSKSEGNRRYRMGVVRDKMRVAPVEVKLIKAADRLDNLQGITEFDKGFRRRYYQESLDLYEALTENIPASHPYTDALIEILDEMAERLRAIKIQLDDEG